MQRASCFTLLGSRGPNSVTVTVTLPSDMMIFNPPRLRMRVRTESESTRGYEPSKKASSLLYYRYPRLQPCPVRVPRRFLVFLFLELEGLVSESF